VIVRAPACLALSRDDDVVVFQQMIFGRSFPPNPAPPSLPLQSFATSVGSKTLKLWHAVIICAIFEFSGAVFMGAFLSRRRAA
tara:strand:- start:103 stop:351 length:249 start_codon:yes stop_codon:yes gene_type:complete